MTPHTGDHRRDRSARTAPLRAGRLVLLLALTTLVGFAGCTPLPSAGPDLATDSAPGSGHPGGAGDPDDPAAGPPPWTAPGTDPLDWRPCPSSIGPDVPPGVRLDCAHTSGATDRKGAPPLTLARIRAEATPADAPPVVVTPGTRPGLAAAVTSLLAAGPELVAGHPLVLIQHRAEVDPAATCLPPDGRQGLAALGGAGVDPLSARVRGTLGDLTQTCLDEIEDHETDFGADGSARDVAALRTVWGVPALVLLSVGDGSDTAVSYASHESTHLAALALDAPMPLTRSQQARARAAAEGSEAALRQWSVQCRRPQCGTAAPADRVAAVAQALAPRPPANPGANGTALDALRAALATARPPGAAAPSSGDDLLAAVATGGGDRALRTAGAHWPSVPDFVAGCTDATDRVPVAEIGRFGDELAGPSPTFGHALAAATARCVAWPVTEERRIQLPHVPALVLGSSADPYSGAAPVETRESELSGAGAVRIQTVSRGFPGGPVLGESPCVRDAAVAFLDHLGQPDTGPHPDPRPVACPA